MNNPAIQSPDPETDTLKCPKCGTLWRAKGHYNYDEGGWNYFNEQSGFDEEFCPSGCKKLFGSRVRGKVVTR